MKKILINIIKWYQALPISWHNYCRHIPTCSNYGIKAITTHGSIKGTILTIKRICKCHPWGTYGYDPVPQKEGKGE